MKRYLPFLVLAAVVLAVAFLLGSSYPSPTSERSSQPTIERTEIVDYVVDGDTIRLQGDEKIRLVCVNTPELDSEDPDEKARAEQAKEFVEGLCPPESEIGLDVDDLEPADHYGRTLAVVYMRADNAWMSVNAELLRLGLAEILFMPPSEFNPYEWLD